VYLRGRDGVYHAHAVQVLTTTRSGIAHIYSFNDPDLFPAFGLISTLGAARVPVASWPD
jgi:RNA polymerase sigma-70 factor (ECF subfamily)